MNIKGKALLAGCIALAFSNMALAEDIKVAVVGAMSGPVAQYGDQEFTGAEQAVADINAKGGIKGNKLQIVKYDDACDPNVLIHEKYEKTGRILDYSGFDGIRFGGACKPVEQILAVKH